MVLYYLYLFSFSLLLLLSCPCCSRCRERDLYRKHFVSNITLFVTTFSAFENPCINRKDTLDCSCLSLSLCTDCVVFRCDCKWVCEGGGCASRKTQEMRYQKIKLLTSVEMTLFTLLLSIFPGLIFECEWNGPIMMYIAVTGAGSKRDVVMSSNRVNVFWN